MRKLNIKMLVILGAFFWSTGLLSMEETGAPSAPSFASLKALCVQQVLNDDQIERSKL